MSEKKVILSGMQPTGFPTIGNYIGAIKHWGRLRDEYDSFFFVADMHALTVRQNPAELRQRSVSLAALYMACGINPSENVLFIQSHVPQHAELCWVLSCFTYMGELSRMTQFKDKSRKNEDNINAGLFTYPSLMAADILLYGTDSVPVGEDQKQHLELARDLAERFNNAYGDVFTVPEPFIQKFGARIMGLQNPEAKMSKSETDNPNDAVFLLDPPSVVLSKLKRAVTDSGAEVRFADDKPGVSNLLTIYAACAEKTIAESERDFAGKGYGDFKTGVAEALISVLSPIQAEYNRIMDDKSYVNSSLELGAQKASLAAERVMRKVRKKVGYYSTK